jgi:hypothetical protein
VIKVGCKIRTKKKHWRDEGLLQQMLADQDDRHQGAECRAFEDLPHDMHGLLPLNVR